MNELEAYVSSYYPTLDQLKETYKENSNGIIAECIFEQLQWGEAEFVRRASNKKEVRKIVYEYITSH